MHIHKNQLSGTLPSFTNFSELQSMTIFNNNFRGTLELPSSSVIQVLIISPKTSSSLTLSPTVTASPALALS